MKRFKIVGYSAVQKLIDILYQEDNMVVESEPYISAVLTLDSENERFAKRVKCKDEQELQNILNGGYYEDKD